MAELRLGNIKPKGADNVVVEGKYVKGGYVTVTTLAERDTLKGTNGENIIKGSLCYVTGTESAPVNKFYQYNGTNWVEKVFGITTEASQTAAGLMSATDKEKLDSIDAGAEENVQADWNQTDENAKDFIKNKPVIPDAQMISEMKAELDKKVTVSDINQDFFNSLYK